MVVMEEVWVEGGPVVVSWCVSTSCDVVFDVLSDSGPPVVAGYQLDGFVFAWVMCFWDIMMETVKGHPSISLLPLFSPTLPLFICTPPTPLYHLQGPTQRPMTFALTI
jgi:hypothetical protein